jgi:phosphoglycerol transferase MdoB-like AlkP superfamily enzyme
MVQPMVRWVLGFSKILGIENHYGRTEFNDDSQFDGLGDLDEPFFSIHGKTLDKRKHHFFATVFTVSSHEPYNILKI